MKRILPIIVLLALAANATALGLFLGPSSFEELVSSSTHIVTASVLSTQTTGRVMEGHLFVTALVDRVISGDISQKSITIAQPRILSYQDHLDIRPGNTYLFFLARSPISNCFEIVRYDWGCWNTENGNAAIQHQGSETLVDIPFDNFVAAIRAEMQRPQPSLPREFLGIHMGHSFNEVEAATQLEFKEFTYVKKEDARFRRYYAFLPDTNKAHMVNLSFCNDKLMYLDVYYLHECAGGPTELIRSYEQFCGGTPLAEFNSFNLRVGRRWADRNVEIRLGEISFIKENGFPWGAFDAYEVSVTDQNVLEEYREQNRQRSQ